MEIVTSRSALEIAARLKEIYYGETGREAATMLRHQHAEIERLKKQVAAYSTLTKSQEAQLSHLRAKDDEYRVAVATPDSELAANERLTAEIKMAGKQQRVGWWAVPEAPITPEGEPASGFFVSDSRAATFSTEPGFTRHKLVPCWIDED